MLDFFLNPGYLAAAAALVSAPIIIHLINRMRFKRIAWAAMEFLLKAQKRMRKRLIIEQLILLALRCLLVALVGLLVMRFVGFSFGLEAKKNALHIVLLDDTPSMLDQWKEADVARDAFTVAKYDVLLGKLVKTLGQTAASDRVMLLPLTRLVLEKDFQPRVYERLNDGGKLKEFKEDLDTLECSKVHVDMLQAVKKVRELINNNVDSRITIHILSDFRQQDWEVAKVDRSGKQAGEEGKDAEENLHTILVKVAKEHPDLKIRMVDTVHPYRQAGQGGVPLAHENVGIVDLRAGTRIAGKDMPVPFTVTLANFSSREVEVNVVIYDDESGAEQPQVDFNPPMPIKLPPDSREVKATFEMRFSPVFKAGEPYYKQISARLQSAQLGKLESDALAIDNVRHAAVEVREKVPVLVIDGEGQRGRQENQDSFFIRTAIASVPGASYEVIYGDELGGGVAVKALERPDLRQYPSIFLLNVRELSDKQVANLENYVKEGGGVAFFMGPQVNPAMYNKKLYKQGKGVFPVPLGDTFFPPNNEEPLKTEFTGDPQLHIREKLFGSLDAVPIFGQVFKEPQQMKRLQDLPVRRYFQVPRSEWQQTPGKTFELATLPNRRPITAFQRATLDIVRKSLEDILKNEEFQKYRPGLDRHRAKIERLVGPTSEEQAGKLFDALMAMIADKGKPGDKDYPNVAEFWSNSDPKVVSLRETVVSLADQARYGDPFIVVSEFGKGRVVAVMTTAGKEWNDWGGGSDATLIYQPFIWEMQNHLSSQGSESSMMVGATVEVVVDSEPYKQKGASRLKMSRIFHQAEFAKPAKLVKQSEQFGVEDKNLVYFSFDKNDEPGLYVGLLKIDDGSDRQPIVASYAQTFNVDTLKEGPLGRVSYDEIEKKIIREAPQGSILFEGPGVGNESLVPRKSDFSESPWLYLIFIAVLIAEQALAVHLSFHLRAGETDALSRITSARQAA